MGRNKNININLNLNVRGMTPSSTLAINERSEQLLGEGREIFKFGLGQSPFPVPKTVVQALRQNAFQKDYLPVKGLPELRDAVADYLLRTKRIERFGKDVIVGPGSKELMFILQLVYYGDLVIPRPSWVSYAPQANIIGRKVNWITTRKTNHFRLTPDELREICADDPQKPRIVILNYPSNPTGGSYKTDELKDVARVARAHKVVLLSDEIYSELHHKGKHVSIARFYPEGTIVSGGLSKWCGAGGWRLGVFAFPKELNWLADAMAVVASETFTSTSAPIQYAAIRAYEGGEEIENYLRLSRSILGALSSLCLNILRDAEIVVPTPQGAFYLFLDFSTHLEALARCGITTSGELCRRLLDEAGVALLPGSDFGMPHQQLTARLSYVYFDGSRALLAAEKLNKNQSVDEAFVKKHCPRVVKGVSIIADWLSSK